MHSRTSRRFPGPSAVVMPANNVPGGRDFILPDLHGRRDELEDLLKARGFSRTRDRLFSVGDLIDRGAQSIECLELLGEPWFFSVLANHECMMLSALCGRESRLHGPVDWFKNGGAWFADLSREAKDRLARTLAHVIQQPLVRVVPHAAGTFNVAHAMLADPFTGELLTDFELTDDNLLENCEEVITWARDLALEAKKSRVFAEVDLGHGEGLGVTGAPMTRNLRLTYVGHTPLKQCLLHRSHLHCDRGAGLSDGKLILLEHGEVMSRLREAGILE